ncbi:MAG: YhbY family RNA-binding protein [Verrucomicrobiota bacterium]
MSVELTGAEKKELRSRAQLLEPVVRIGIAGKSEAVLRSLEEALDLHELVKLKFTEFKEEKKVLSAELAQETRSALVQVVGNVAVFYRPRPASAK